jgi:hypothetical protein
MNAKWGFDFNGIVVVIIITNRKFNIMVWFQWNCSCVYNNK